MASDFNIFSWKHPFSGCGDSWKISAYKFCSEFPFNGKHLVYLPVMVSSFLLLTGKLYKLHTALHITKHCNYLSNVLNIEFKNWNVVLLLVFPSALQSKWKKIFSYCSASFLSDCLLVSKLHAFFSFTFSTAQEKYKCLLAYLLEWINNILKRPQSCK